MIKSAKKPEMRARELRDGSGWFVLVRWGDWPSEQVGGFPSEEEAQMWIDQNSTGWLQTRGEQFGPEYGPER
jgi:hypothetical protein